MKTVSIGLFSIRCGEKKIDYLPWRTSASGRKRLAEAFEENELRIESQLKSAPDGDVFLLKFVLQNAVFRLHDPLVYAPVIVFHAENLGLFLDKISGRKRIIIEPPFDKNPALYTLIRRLISARKDVVLETQQPGELSIRITYLFPLFAQGLYALEALVGLFKRIGRKRKPERSFIFSNFRHYSKHDSDNVFWANLLPLLPRGREASFVYYNQFFPIQRHYYARFLTDRKHVFLTEALTLSGFAQDLRTYLSISVPESFSYQYKGVEYGDILLPLVSAFYRILYPFLLKQRRALQKMLASHPKAVFVDSELSLIGFQLGFIRNTAKIVAMSNEIIDENYAMPKYSPDRPRPRFDSKLVYGERELRMLRDDFGYPEEKLVLFPDPRFLDALFGPKPLRKALVYVSQAHKSELLPVIAQGLRCNATLSRIPFVVKPHPLEDPRSLKSRLGNSVEVSEETTLQYVPTYALTHNSTFGLELLFQGSTVFFLNPYTFDIVKRIPMLYCKDVDEVLKTLQRLENSPSEAKALRERIKRYLAERYADTSPTRSREILKSVLEKT